jgi:VIT1/CCC1 family predicted Fe2+/Mn2+ transporter
MINGLTLFSKDSPSINRIFFVFLIVAVNLLWGIFDGLMLIFTNLLEEGRYNKMISRIKSSDKKLATELIKNELGDTIISRCDKGTKEQLIETVLNNFSSTPSAIFKKPKISQNDIIAALICTFFVFLPCIVILPFFLLINNLTLAILVSNIISLGMLFAFGYKLGSCTDRNKIITGMIIMLIGLVIIIAAIAFEIY